MNRSFARHAAVALVFAFFTTGCAAQAPRQDYQPEVGQPGKDVVWVPTAQVMVDRMLDMAKVTSSDYVIDLGSGDGRTVIQAAKRGARALGIEYNPDMVELSKRNAAKEGVSDRASFVKADIFQSDFSQATVITLFLLPDLNLKLRPTLLSLKPGTRIVSNSFTMGEWEDDDTLTADAKDGCTYWCIAHMWVVPAKIEGTWRLPQGELTLGQNFQKLSGTLKSPSGTTPVLNGRLRGETISFVAGGSEYSGRVSGNTIQGSVKAAGKTSNWTATKIGG
ncbi:MAG: RNA methyltransferase [Betaproteobacteria bacterium RIFCSPLOWO2_02_FULL_65_24]|nr:MAG: RNA methyltransferase [Betaproteobacteria bacterium RIFCSPLOWO2_02_FULL_65_24]OGA31623.1 MAG: RNA methyltransferase [Betaproteobacteria bacterium RIFCSPLOWO2_12_FULL_62_13b]